MNIYGTARITGSVDTATVAHIWAGNTEGDLRKVNLGGDITIQGDSIKVNVPALPPGTVLNSTLRWDGTTWVENDSLLVNEKGESAFGGTAINTARSITTSKDIAVNGIRIGRGQSNNVLNIAIGNLALNNNSASEGNIAIGPNALQSSIAWGNTAIGRLTLSGFNGGQSNTAVGEGAASFATGSGSFNVYMGRLNSRSSTSSYNTVAGYQALYSQTSSGSNTVSGYQALYTLTGAGATFNTVMGTEAGRDATGITGVSWFGAGSGYNSTSKHSIFLGRNSGFHVTKDSTLIIQSTSDSIATIVGDLGRKKVGINRGPWGISRTLDVGGDLRVRTNVDTATLSRLWAGNPEGDLKRVYVGDGLGFVGDTLKATSIYVPVPAPYMQANADVSGYNDTINASQSKPIKFDWLPWAKDWAQAGDWLEYQGLDTFIAKIHVEVSLSVDAATTGQLVFYSNAFNVQDEMYGEEVAFNAGTQTITITNHTLYGVPLVNSIVGADEFAVYLKNTSGNTRIFTIHRAKVSIIKVADWDPEFGD